MYRCRSWEREVSRVGEEQGKKDETVEYMVFRASGANCVQSECGRGNVEDKSTLWFTGMGEKQSKITRSEGQKEKR